MDQFTVVDLYAQRQQVREYVQGWLLDEILEWLKQFGEVREIDSPYGQNYGFRSASGAKAGFWFSDSNGLQILSV